jgi:hypothetical protein
MVVQHDDLGGAGDKPLHDRPLVGEVDSAGMPLTLDLVLADALALGRKE